MKRTFAAAAALSGTVCFGILWLNNLISARRYYALLFRGEYTDRFPPGFAPLLDWSTVDVSTVTTFIPFFGFVLILYRIFRPAEDPGCPFFPGYDRFNLALGLLGTIWGIILVGYYPAEQITIAALMRCLHTAMFSTLVAVAWVMVLMPAAVLPLLRSCRGSGPEDEPELDRLIGRISAGLAAATEELRSSTAESARFRAGLAETAGALRELRHNAAAGREAETAWQKSAAETLNALAEAIRRLDLHQQRLREENGRLSAENAELNRQLTVSEDTIRELRQTIEQIRSALR